MLVWLDLEMTGLDPARDVILEIATLVTDDDLTIVAEGPDLVVHQPDDVLRRMDAFVADMARRIAVVLQPVVAILEPDAMVLGGPTGVAGGVALADATARLLHATDQSTGSIVTSAVPMNTRATRSHFPSLHGMCSSCPRRFRSFNIHARSRRHASCTKGC